MGKQSDGWPHAPEQVSGGVGIEPKYACFLTTVPYGSPPTTCVILGKSFKLWVSKASFVQLVWFGMDPRFTDLDECGL